MNRREFLQGAAGAVALVAAGIPLRAAAEERIGVVSWSVRSFIKGPARGRPPASPIPDDRKFDLLEFPQLMKDRVGLTLLDLVNTHFASTDPGYLEQLTTALSKAGAHVWNVK